MQRRAWIMPWEYPRPFLTAGLWRLFGSIEERRVFTSGIVVVVVVGIAHTSKCPFLGMNRNRKHHRYKKHHHPPRHGAEKTSHRQPATTKIQTAHIQKIASSNHQVCLL